MGQKIHPVGLRLGITRTWDSRWFEKKNYKVWLHEDVSIRKYFGRLTRAAAISRVEIERRANQARIIVHTAKPGIIIGKRGVGIEDIRRSLERLTQKNVQVNVIEIKYPELDARLVAQNIVDQLEKRIAFRRAMKQAIMRTMKAGARGVKVMVSGRLGGSEIARSEQNHDGKVPLHTLRADIDYAHVEAFTTFGRIGCKVWIYKGEVLPDQTTRAPERERTPAERATFRDRRGERRGGRGRGGGQQPRPPEPVTNAAPPASETLPYFKMASQYVLARSSTTMSRSLRRSTVHSPAPNTPFRPGRTAEKPPTIQALSTGTALRAKPHRSIRSRSTRPTRRSVRARPQRPRPQRSPNRRKPSTVRKRPANPTRSPQANALTETNEMA